MRSAHTDTNNLARIAVFGAGSWGTALAATLAANGAQVRLWARDPLKAEQINHERENRYYLPGVRLPALLSATSSVTHAVADADEIWLVMPIAGLSDFLAEHQAILPRDIPYISGSKGFEHGSGRRVSELVKHHLGAVAFAVVSGPTFALEVAQGSPSAIAVASTDPALAEATANRLRNQHIRCYGLTDVTGVELAGGLKNVLAIAAGTSDGFGFGANARAALITRGLAEISRLGAAMDADAHTFTGLAGLGDLVLTCTDNHSRNRRFGLLLAQGVERDQAIAQIGQAVEGIGAATEGVRLAEQYQQDLPIISVVHRVLHEGLPARAAVAELLSREPKRLV